MMMNTIDPPLHSISLADFRKFYMNYRQLPVTQRPKLGQRFYAHYDLYSLPQTPEITKILRLDGEKALAQITKLFSFH